MGRESQGNPGRKAGQPAREAIMDTAERLFGDRGIDAVSLRTINTEAGYSVAALHYHFGTRDGLIRALLARAQPSMLASRDRMVAELRPLAKPPLERIVDALVAPLTIGLLANQADGARRLRFLARLYFDRSPWVAGTVAEGLAIFLPLLRRALPELDEGTLKRRWAIASELAAHAVANARELHSGAVGCRHMGRGGLERFLGELVQFIAGGLSAPRQGT
jgi:AcrR family transcriptional regulator